ncbi:MAG: response regulator [Candidatus Omnitrophota bacterium]
MSDKAILLVEDNQDDIDLTIRALKHNNITNEVVVLNDGEDALEYLFHEGKYSELEPGNMPAVVLLDIKLPKLNGLEVLKKLRSNERTKVVPVVILTSSQEESDVLNGYNLGCNSYVRKPVDFEQFSEAVRQLGLYWLLLNEPPKTKD